MSSAQVRCLSRAACPVLIPALASTHVTSSLLPSVVSSSTSPRVTWTLLVCVHLLGSDQHLKKCPRKRAFFCLAETEHSVLIAAQHQRGVGATEAEAVRHHRVQGG